MFKSQRNVILCVSAILLYWLVLNELLIKYKIDESLKLLTLFYYAENLIAHVVDL